MGTVTLKKLPLVIEDMELGRGLTSQNRGGVPQSYKRIGGSTLPYDAIDGPTLKEKIDALDAAGYIFSGLHDPSGGQEYPATPENGYAYTVDLPLITPTYTFAAGDLTGWVCKAGDIMVYNVGWTLIKVSVASDEHLRIDGSNTMGGAIRMGDTNKITNMADGGDDQDAATVKQVNLKASIASPTFTGIPAVPTAVVNTDTTQVASTAFVQVQLVSYEGGIEVVVNSNGRAVKFPDGTLICTHSADVNVNLDTAVGSLYFGDLPVMIFPVTFIATPQVSGNLSSGLIVWFTTGFIGTTNFTHRAMVPVTGASVTRIEYTAVGRWK